MKANIKVKAGSPKEHHNKTLVRAQKPTQGLKVKTNLKAGSRNLLPEEQQAVVDFLLT